MKNNYPLIRFTSWLLLLLLGAASACEETEENQDDPLNNTQGKTINLRVLSGDNQSALPGDTLPQPLVIQALNEQNLPVAGVPINWSLVSDNGSILLNPGTATGTNGTASTRWVMGLHGEHRLAVSTGNIALVMQAAFTPIQFTFITPPNQMGYQRELLEGPFKVRATLPGGIPLTKKPLTLAVVSGNGTLRADQVTTDKDGEASIEWILGLGSDQKLAVSFAGSRNEYKPPVDTNFFMTATVNGKKWLNYSKHRNMAYTTIPQTIPLVDHYYYSIHASKMVFPGTPTPDTWLTITTEPQNSSYPLTERSFYLPNDPDNSVWSNYSFLSGLARFGIKAEPSYGDAGNLNKAGTLTITKVTKDAVEGTFSFNEQGIPNFSSSISVRDGQFRVRRQLAIAGFPDETVVRSYLRMYTSDENCNTGTDCGKTQYLENKSTTRKISAIIKTTRIQNKVSVTESKVYILNPGQKLALGCTSECSGEQKIERVIFTAALS